MSEHVDLRSPEVRCYPPGSPWRSAPKTGSRQPGGTLSESELRSRMGVLAEIALRYHELVSPGNTLGYGSVDGGYPHMPKTYTPTVREFERLMGVMRSRYRQHAYQGIPVGTLRWHVLEWYVNAEKVIRHDPILVPKKGQKHKRKPQLVALRDGHGRIQTRQRVAYLRHPDARIEKARLGLRWIALEWSLASGPMLPPKPPDEQGREAA